MGKTLGIRSIEEFERRYFPKAFKKKKIEEMTPEKRVRYLGRKSIEELNIDNLKISSYNRC